MSPSGPDELADLRLRLEELQEALRAIRDGEVDGLVVSGPDGAHVFALRGAEHPYRVFVEEMSEGALTVNEAGLIVFCNRRLAELLGVRVSSIIGQTLEAIPNPDLRTALSSLILPDAPASMEIVDSSNGRVISLSASRSSAEGLVAVLVLDVTEPRSREASLQRLNTDMEDRIRERTAALARSVDELRNARMAALNMMEDAVHAARALEQANRDLEQQVGRRRASEEAYRRLAIVVEQAAESILITNTEGIIEYVNPAFERVTGYSREEVLGQTPRILKSGKQDASVYEDLWRNLKGGNSWTGHLVNRRKNGALYEEEATISPVRDIDGTITNFVAIKRDITAEVALNEQLRHSQKIEAIGTLAGGIAHDFNNLLQAMLSIVQVIQRKKNEPERFAEYLRQIEQTIRRGSQLTRQLLLFARRETSRREDLDLNEVLSQLAVFLRRVVRENVVLTIRPSGEALPIHADRGQVEQVLVNLTVNAIDAMLEGGTLAITATRSGDSARLEVSDSGTGIPEEIRSRIFEPFFTTKEAGKGTGLGLSVVHGIVSSHGGRIEVDCPDGGGTTFRVELPLLTAEALPAQPEAVKGHPEGRGELVLLIEDEETTRAGLTAVLEMLGYRVIAAGTAEDALALPDSTSFSAVLTDFMLPGMHGLEAVRRLRERNPEIRAVLMSGYAKPGAIGSAVEEHLIEVLQKPFDMTALALALRTVLSREVVQ